MYVPVTVTGAVMELGLSSLTKTDFVSFPALVADEEKLPVATPPEETHSSLGTLTSTALPAAA